jgi:hypothetical protein
VKNIFEEWTGLEHSTRFILSLSKEISYEVEIIDSPFLGVDVGYIEHVCGTTKNLG